MSPSGSFLNGCTDSEPESFGSVSELILESWEGIRTGREPRFGDLGVDPKHWFGTNPHNA